MHFLDKLIFHSRCCGIYFPIYRPRKAFEKSEKYIIVPCWTVRVAVLQECFGEKVSRLKVSLSFLLSYFSLSKFCSMDDPSLSTPSPSGLHYKTPSFSSFQRAICPSANFRTFTTRCVRFNLLHVPHNSLLVSSFSLCALLRFLLPKTVPHDNRHGNRDGFTVLEKIRSC